MGVIIISATSCREAESCCARRLTVTRGRVASRSCTQRHMKRHIHGTLAIAPPRGHFPHLSNAHKICSLLRKTTQRLPRFDRPRRPHDVVARSEHVVGGGVGE
ncbi:hypothetical protein FOA52_014443 [Chlamydomonas sp. UWO 241]|nr:hypothetical protein FOA52_014443 [Chlamydomonas sp. UWO 241]